MSTGGAPVHPAPDRHQPAVHRAHGPAQPAAVPLRHAVAVDRRGHRLPRHLPPGARPGLDLARHRLRAPACSSWAPSPCCSSSSSTSPGSWPGSTPAPGCWPRSWPSCGPTHHMTRPAHARRPGGPACRPLTPRTRRSASSSSTTTAATSPSPASESLLAIRLAGRRPRRRHGGERLHRRRGGPGRGRAPGRAGHRRRRQPRLRRRLQPGPGRPRPASTTSPWSTTTPRSSRAGWRPSSTSWRPTRRSVRPTRRSCSPTASSTSTSPPTRRPAAWATGARSACGCRAPRVDGRDVVGRPAARVGVLGARARGRRRGHLRVDQRRRPPPGARPTAVPRRRASCGWPPTTTAQSCVTLRPAAARSCT